MTPASIFQVDNLHLQQGPHRLCQGFHWQVHAGEIWGLLGANGRGKTTVLHTLAGLQPAHAGHIHFRGKPLSHWPKRQLAQQLGLLTQSPHYPFPLRVDHFVAQGRYPQQGLWPRPSETDHQAVAPALALTQLTGLSTRLLHQLSGGEQQRAGIASLLAQACPVLLLDEPCNHLDIPHQVHLLDALIRQSQRLGGACILSLHDINLAARVCSHLLLLTPQGWLTGPAAQMLQADLLSHTYQHPIQAHPTPQGPVFLPLIPPTAPYDN